jgi:hypothetical protein
MEAHAEALVWAEELADRVLAGGEIDRGAARRILAAPDAEVPDLLRARRACASASTAGA